VTEAEAKKLLRKYSEFCLWFGEVGMLSAEMEAEGVAIRRGLAEMMTSADEYLRKVIQEQHPKIFQERLDYGYEPGTSLTD
jgi:hypothetical protein